MNILITGACGQLGRTLRDVSEGYDHGCVFADEPADVLNVMRTNAVDVIINCPECAGSSAVLASAAMETGALLIHVSSVQSFDGEADLVSEKAVVESGCRYIVFRTSWMYSCYGDNFFTSLEDGASRLPYMEVPVDQVGTPTYAYDLAHAIFSIIDEGRLGNTGVYQYSNEGLCSKYDFAMAAKRGLGYTCDIRPCFTGGCSGTCMCDCPVLDKSLFRKTFGYEIPHWEDSLMLCINEFQRKINK